MKCQHVRELLPLYADQDLEGSEREQVERHLETCEECRRRLELDGRLAAALRELPAAQQAAALAPAVRKRVMGTVRSERRWGSLWRAAGRLGNAAAWAAVATVAVLLAAALTLTWKPLLERRAQPGLPSTTEAPGLGWRIVSDEVIAAPYYWVAEGERVDRTPQLSPDGTKVAYLPTVDGKATDLDRLVVRDLATNQDRDLTPEAGYSYTSVRWSPDSRSLAFVKHRPEPDKASATEVWRIDADGRDLKLLYRQDAKLASTPGPSLAIERWSADGRYIEVQPTIWSWSDSHGGRQRVHADGSGIEDRAYPTAADLGVGEGAPVGREVFSPAGDYFLHAVKTDGLLHKPEGAPADGQSLVLYDFQARRVTVLGSFPDVIQLTDADVSPDGQWISFVTAPSPESEVREPGKVWVVRRDGTGLRQVTTAEGHAVSPMPGPLWAAGGRAYYNQPREVSAIWICEVDAASGRAALITNQWPAQGLVSVSRDGRRLLAISGESDTAKLHLLELAPGEPAGPTATPAPVPTVAPAEEPKLGPPQDLLAIPPSVGSNYRVSPDGNWVAYRWAPEDDASLSQLVARSLTGDRTVVLIDGLEGDCDFAWLPDSSGLAVAVRGHAQDRLFIMGLEPGSQTLAMGPDGAYTFGEVAVSPDGSRIAFTVLYPDDPAPVPKIAIDVMNRDGSGRHRIVEPDYFIGHLAWRADGTQVVYFKGKGGTPPDDGESYAVNADGSAAPERVLARARLVAWSPDGTQALWLGEPADAQGNADLWLTGLWPSTAEYVPIVRGVSATGATWTTWNGSNGWVAYAQNGAIYLKWVGLWADGRTRRLTPEGEKAAAPVWIPGRGLAYEATRPDTASPMLRLLPLPGVIVGQGTPSGQAAGLVVEEYPVADLAKGLPTDVEGTGWLAASIRDKRAAWREPGPAERVAASNKVLRPFGYRLVAKDKPGFSFPLYDLYRGDQVVLSDLDAVSPVSVSANGDDFCLVVEKFNGGYHLVRKADTQPWDPLRYVGAPVFVGQDLVIVERDEQAQRLVVRRGPEAVYTWDAGGPRPDDPCKGLWSWEGHWVLEVDGRLVVDGQEMNPQLGYDEVFNWRLVRGKPFYFFRQGEQVSISYGGQVLLQQYDKVRHYECCSGAAYNPGGNDTMVWFFGLRGNTWYYVEMGVYGAGEPVSPVPGATATWDAQRVPVVETVVVPTSTPLPQPTAAPTAVSSIYSIHMVDATTGWAENGVAILRTTDGGAHWADVTPQDSAVPRALVGNNRFDGTCFRDGDHAWVAVRSGPESPLTVLRTSDGGRIWQSTTLTASGMGEQFSFADSEHGWMMVHLGAAAGSEGVAILKTADGGQSWTEVTAALSTNSGPGRLPFGGSKTGCTFRDETTGWVTGFAPVDGKAYLYVTRDGGRTWQEQSLPLPEELQSAQLTTFPPRFFTAQDGILLVTLWHEQIVNAFYSTHDGGASWSAPAPLTSTIDVPLASDWVSGSEGWVLAAPANGDTGVGQLYHTRDGGQSWTALEASAVLAKVVQLDMVDSQVGWALGKGFLLKTTDGGQTWALVGG